jgi:hypothetical protein
MSRAVPAWATLAEAPLTWSVEVFAEGLAAAPVPAATPDLDAGTDGVVVDNPALAALTAPDGAVLVVGMRVLDQLVPFFPSSSQGHSVTVEVCTRVEVERVPDPVVVVPEEEEVVVTLEPEPVVVVAEVVVELDEELDLQPV